MIDLLAQMGIPAIFILLLVVLSAIIWKYFNHRLEIEKQRFSSEIETIQAIHKERFSAVESINHYTAELYHNLRHLSEEPNRKSAIEEYCATLRSFVREKVLILGNEVQEVVYALTDYAKSVIEGHDRYEDDKFWELDRDVSRVTREILRTIPRIPKDILK